MIQKPERSTQNTERRRNLRLNDQTTERLGERTKPKADLPQRTRSGNAGSGFENLDTYTPRYLDTEFSALDQFQYLQGFHILDAVNGVPALAPEGEYAAGPKDPEVLRDIGLFEVQFLSDVGYAAALLIEKLKNPDSRRVSQGL